MMTRYFFFFLFLIATGASAQVQLKDLPAATSAVSTDIVGLQIDVTGTMRDRKMTLANLALNLDPQLTAIAGSTPAANQIFIWGSATSGSYVTLSANVQSLFGAADYAAMRTQLSLVPGTNVQAYNANLTSWAAIAPGTGVGTALAIDANTTGGFVTVDGTVTLTNKTLTSPTINGVTITGTCNLPNTLTFPTNTLSIPLVAVTASSFSGDGSALTALNASNLASGTVASARGGAGTVNGIMKANGSGAVSAASAGTDYLSPGATQTVTATTIDATAGTNVISFIDERDAGFPQQVDGTGCTIDPVSTSPTFGQAIFSGTAAKTANYCIYRFRVPFDLDTGTDLQACLTYRLGGADTNKHRYEISMSNIASSGAQDSPTFSNAVNLDFTPGDGSGAAGDAETIAYTTLTSWRTSLTAGNIIAVKLARVGDDGTNDDSTVASSTISLTFKFKRTQ